MQKDAQGLNTIKRTETNELQISLYVDNLAGPKEVAIAVKKLSTAFKNEGKGFWNLLAERIMANNFTEKRLADAVGNVLDNFRYKELNIADVISFDRRVKLYSAREYMDAQSSGIHMTEFEKREIDGRCFFVLKDDLIRTYR